jgi:hypothetical protein
VPLVKLVTDPNAPPDTITCSPKVRRLLIANTPPEQRWQKDGVVHLALEMPPRPPAPPAESTEE